VSKEKRAEAARRDDLIHRWAATTLDELARVIHDSRHKDRDYATCETDRCRGVRSVIHALTTEAPR
jgi:hypothetical protein